MLVEEGLINVYAKFKILKRIDKYKYNSFQT